MSDPASSEQQGKDIKRDAERWLESPGSGGMSAFPVDLVRTLLARVQELEALVETLRPDDITADECSVAVHTLRMRRSGYSYDAKAGIWWKDDSKPGVLEAVEAWVQELEREVADLKKGLET